MKVYFKFDENQINSRFRVFLKSNYLHCFLVVPEIYLKFNVIPLQKNTYMGSYPQLSNRKNINKKLMYPEVINIIKYNIIYSYFVPKIKYKHNDTEIKRHTQK